MAIRKPSLSDIISVIDEVTILANDPLFFNNAVEQYPDKTEKSPKNDNTKYFFTRKEGKEGRAVKMPNVPEKS